MLGFVCFLGILISIGTSLGSIENVSAAWICLVGVSNYLNSFVSVFHPVSFACHGMPYEEIVVGDMFARHYPQTG